MPVRTTKIKVPTAVMRANAPAPAKARRHAARATPPRRCSPQEEQRRFMDFWNSLGSRMLFLPSSTFTMGCAAPGAPANEQPTTRVTLSRFYLSRFPSPTATTRSSTRRTLRGAARGRTTATR